MPKMNYFGSRVLGGIFSDIIIFISDCMFESINQSVDDVKISRIEGGLKYSKT